MKREDAVRLIREHREEITAFGVRRIALFGSVARDEGRPDSDVDVLVEFDGAPTFRGHMGLLVLLESLLGTRVDLATPEMIRPEQMEIVRRDLLDVA
ncbi:MAG: nucleotidyltransferase domain-containing protein [Chloroflexi bacterium]|nr:nucleotidyltransferase domain-containing protein [Chloroflexota bacterium]